MNEEELQKLLLAAKNTLQQGDQDGAIKLYEDIASKDPNNAEAHMRLAELYTGKGLKDQASRELLLLGDAYYESRLFKNALRYFQKVLELDPGQIDARTKAAEIYVNEEMEREAKLEYLAIAEYYLSSADMNKAEEFAGKAINLKSIEAHYIMGLVHFKRGMYKEAAVSLETLCKIKVNHVGALIHLGFSQIENGKFTDSIAAFERVMKIEPASIDALKGLTDAFARKGSSMEAAGYYTKAIDAMLKAKVFEDALKFGLQYI
ncbi:MAG: tetratricopeptide repeat protein, partial [Candidatus Firestonebacteria bacterium]